MIRTALSTAALAAILAVGCGGDDVGGAGAADAATAPDAGPTADAAVEPEPDAMPQLTELDALCDQEGPFVALVDKAATCVSFLTFLRTVDPYVLAPDRLEGECRFQYGGFVDDGTITIDEEAIAACRAYVDETPCELLGFFGQGGQLHGTPCDAILVGTVEDAGECDISAQCEGDRYCSFEQPQPAGLSTTECGQCTDRLADDAPCTFDEQCASGACLGDQTCGSPGQVGAACQQADDCGGSLACGPDDLCVLSYPREGDPCVEHIDCAGSGELDTGLYCEMIDGTCRPLPGPGAPCLENVAGHDRLCNPFEYVWCDPIDDLCKAPVTAQAGEACSAYPTVGSGARRCAPEMACTDPFGQTDGAPDGVCFAPGGEGDACGMEADGSDPCQVFLDCVDGTCEYLGGDYSGMCPAAS